MIHWERLTKVGIVASDSSQDRAEVLLQEGYEGEVKAEDLVLVNNRVGGGVLGVLRSGIGLDESLKIGAYRPSLAYAKKGGAPSGARELFAFRVQVLGNLSPDGDGLDRSRVIIAPRSEVFLLDEQDDPNPMQLIAGKKNMLWMPSAHYEDRTSWVIPVEPEYLNYHVGIYGSTGCGKSYLARYCIIPLYLRAGYRVVVLDWSGVDYAPHYKSTLRLRDIALDEEAVLAYLSTKMRYFGYTGEKRTSNEVMDALEQFIGDDWVATVHSFDCDTVKLRQALEDRVRTILSEDKKWGPAWVKKFERSLKKLRNEHLEVVVGTQRVDGLVSEFEDILAIDMHEVGSEEKLSFFRTLASHLVDLMNAGKELKLALVIDEGPQYCPWEPRRLQYDATELIKELCALGRKHKLATVILSQGVAGDIGINAAVRRNLNTQFFGRIHPLDMLEVGNWLSPYGITPEDLLTLEPGRFFYAGRMSPNPIPLLITFTIAR